MPNATRDAKRQAGSNPCGARPRTVVTMSSFYGRHTSLPMVVQSILDQSCAPDAIYIFLSLVHIVRDSFHLLMLAHSSSRIHFILLVVLRLG